MGKKRAKIQLDPEQLPPHLRQALREKTMASLRELFEGEDLPIATDPDTGELMCHMRRVYDKLGLDFETERDKMLTDPVLSKGLRILDHMPPERGNLTNP